MLVDLMRWVKDRDARSDDAMELLGRSDILALMAADLDAMGAVGETENKQVLFLAMISRLLQRPVNVVVKGPSSSGKSHLVRKVAELFGDSVMMLSSMSPRALYYMGEHELRHRVLFVDEYMAHAGRDHALRLLQSEGRLIISVTLQEKGEGLVTRTRRVDGPIAFITTTTRSNIFDENETRAFALQTDCSEEQTRRIHDAQRLARSEYPPEPRYDLARWQEALELLEPLEVVVPFAEHIHLAPTGQARDRRDLGRILSLIEASALLHQMQRQHIERGRRTLLVADLEDYRIAYRLSSAFLAAPSEVDSRLEELMAVCRSLKGEAASHYQLMDVLDWSRPTVIKYCQKALKNGCLRLADGSNRGPKRYLPVADRPSGTLTPPEEVAAAYDQTAMAAVH